MTFKVDCLDFFSFTHDKKKIKSEEIKERTALHYLYSDCKKIQNDDMFGNEIIKNNLRCFNNEL